MSISNTRLTPIQLRVTVIGGAAAALVLLYGVSATVGSVADTTSAAFYAASTRVLDIVNVTVILLWVAALAVTALVRQLHYGIGAVLACTIGATISGHALGALARTDVTAALPNGSVIAVTSCTAAAIMVAPRYLIRAVTALGAGVSILVVSAAWTSGAASVDGIAGALLVTAVWWAGASIVMLFSPVAAEREAQNPLDTAALALHRRMDLPLDERQVHPYEPRSIPAI